MQIMVVDDSRQIRRHVIRTLQELGHECSEAENGKVCIENLTTAPVELILLDWNMPVMDGLETLKAIKTSPQWNSIRVIMMTTENKDEKIQSALSCGADEYIMKPLTKEVLLEKIDALNDDFI
jgi:two-component system, chemotaxis family, chemotaxis protein CheY